MNSSYQELIDELDDLVERSSKLYSFLGSELFCTISPYHAGLLQKQYALIYEYGEILSERIALLKNQD